MTHKEYADSLRLIAEFFERHQEFPLPRNADTYDVFSMHGKEQAAMAARILSPCEKRFGDAFEDSFTLHKAFGSITMRVVFDRGDVCTLKVIGKRHIERQVVPERIIEAHDEEITEWDCGAVLEPSEETNNANS